MSERKRATVQIGKLPIGIDWDHRLGPLSSDALYDNFRCDNTPEITLKIHCGFPPPIPDCGKLVFDSQSHWKLFQANDSVIIILESSLNAQIPYSMGIFDNQFKHGEVYIAPREQENNAADSEPGVLDHSIMQILTISLMSQFRGMMVHACGVEHNRQGYLFVAHSGSGKSTMARLWNKRAAVLNDDRILLCRNNPVIKMYGTPWHGEHKSGISYGVPLKKCFFLNRGESNEAFQVNGASACAMLLARSFPPLWDPEGMRFTLDFAAELTSEIPIYELSFVPTEEVIDFVLCLK
jgi:hypothetical protein